VNVFSGTQKDVRLVGKSPAMRAIEADVACAARSDAKVLITGETGVGKEVIARLIHRESPRSGSPLVTLNCAGLPDSLLESELFGHVRGSFTGAYRDKPGLLEMAPGGTVFLDEVGEMSPRMQVVLLRFLESGEIQRVGSERAHTRVNVRLITATNRDLRAQIVKGEFREDLYFRLNVVHIEVPPLRERVDDVLVLMQYYLDQYAKSHKLAIPQLSADALEALMAHRWPGNVRELKNVAERVVLRHPGRLVSVAELPSDVLKKPAAQPVIASYPPVRTVAEELTERMMQHGESFWSAVYPQFMSRDITRLDLRAVVQIGLESTNGNYRLLVRLFNMPQEDYKRFLSLLRKHDCHLPFQKFRAVPARLSANLPALAKEA